MSKTVGVINSYYPNKALFKWSIHGFFSQPFHNDYRDSPLFYFSKAEWFLRVRVESEGTKEWVKMYLVVVNPSSSYSVTFTLGTECCTGPPCQFGPVTRVFDENHTCHGKERLIIRYNVKGNLPNGYFEVYCNVAENHPSTACQTTSLESTTIPCRSVENLLLTGRKSDVTIAVHGKEFKAHKLILEAHSPVFAAMFENDMTEKATSFINVEDCDPDTFQNFLQFLYAGKVDDLPVGMVIRLYMISHKYTVTEIMKKCVRCMEEKLNEENVLNILALAKRYNERRLIELAEEFIPQNMHKIISTNSWDTLTQENLLQKEDWCVKRRRITIQQNKK